MHEKNNDATPSTAQAFVLARVFDAPLELVWPAWTEPARLAKWWGPKGFTIQVSKLELHPGGVFHYSMSAPAYPMAGRMWGRFVYREIAAPERIVFISSFSDESGGITRHPMSPTWPLEVRNMQTFTEEQGKTTVTLQCSPLNATDLECQTFALGHVAMQQGFSGTLDQLAAYLADELAKR